MKKKIIYQLKYLSFHIKYLILHVLFFLFLSSKGLFIIIKKIRLNVFKFNINKLLVYFKIITINFNIYYFLLRKNLRCCKEFIQFTLYGDSVTGISLNLSVHQENFIGLENINRAELKNKMLILCCSLKIKDMYYMIINSGEVFAALWLYFPSCIKINTEPSIFQLNKVTTINKYLELEVAQEKQKINSKYLLISVFRSKFLKSLSLQNIFLKSNGKININNYLNKKTFMTSQSVLFTKPSNLKKKKSELNVLGVGAFRLLATEPDKTKLNENENTWLSIWAKNKTLSISSASEQLRSLGKYSPDISDILFLKKLNEKRNIIKSKYVFNSLLSSSHLIGYKFTDSKNIGSGSIRINLNSLYKYLKSFFISIFTLISKPILEIYPDKIRIRLFYYVLPSRKKIIQSKLCGNVTKIFKYNSNTYKEKMQNLIYGLGHVNFANKIISNKLIKLTLFIAKWKEDTDFIRSSKPFSLFKGVKLEHLSFISELKNKNKITNIEPIEALQADILIAKQEIKNIKSSLLHPITKQQILSNTLTLSDNAHLSNKVTSDIKAFTSIMFMEKNIELSSIMENLKWQRSQNPSTSVEKISQRHSLSLSSTLNKLKHREESTIVTLNKNKFKYLLFILEKLFKKTIILDLIRLKYPYHESNILAQILAINSKTKNFRIILKSLLYIAKIKTPSLILKAPENKKPSGASKDKITEPATIIPSYISGLKVKLSGRLITQKIVPRFTVQSSQIGSIGRGNTNFINSSRVTLKNKRGVFSFTVSTSHILKI